MSTYYLGVDTGGTFTDYVEIDQDGRVHFEKTFSTPKNPDEAILNVLDQVANGRRQSRSDLLSSTLRFSHGTTVSTNALIERKGARVGLITTAGFEDTLLIARGGMGRTGGLPYLQAMDFIHTEKPEQLVEKSRIVGVSERISSSGAILMPLNEAEVIHAVDHLLNEGVESIAICLLWSFRNPDHENRIRELIRELAPDIPLSLSCEISPGIGEFERTVTTVINAFIGPVMDRYIGSLAQALKEAGYERQLQVMKSSGGLLNPEEVQKQAVSTINSGPIGGLVAARHLGSLLGYENIITADMGGTSFDVGLIADGQFEEERSPFVDQGLPVQIPAIKVVTIGAGGGSIAWTDGTRLMVGPKSAGSVPGPACYKNGGDEPTVTDALVALGIIDPTTFFGGRYELNRDASLEAIRKKVAEPLGLDVLAAAAGIFEVVTAKMSDLIRKVTVESGYDPRTFCLMAYGGATGAHCAAFAGHLGINNVVVPYTAPVFSAFGIAFSDILYTYSQSHPITLENAQVVSEVGTRELKGLAKRAAVDLDHLELNASDVLFHYKIDLRYQGQMNEVTISWPRATIDASDMSAIVHQFESIYEQKFGVGTTRKESRLELINFRLDVINVTEKPALANRIAEPEASGPHTNKTRKVYVHGRGEVDADVVPFREISSGQRINGPAIIERDDTTLWITLGSWARIDEYGNTFIHRVETEV
jgi:N-methylhydantoinase A